MSSRESISDIGPARRWTIVGLLAIAGFINYQDRSILSIALPAIGTEFHLDPTAKGVLLSAFFWSYAFMQLPMGWWSDRLNLRWFYALAFAVWSITCGLAGFAQTVGVLIVLRIALGLSESVYLPGGIKAVSLLFGAKQRGLPSGLVNCGTRAGLALGVPMTAALIVRFGWRAAFPVIGFTSLLWLIPWLLCFPKKIQEPRSELHAEKEIEESGSHRRALIGVCLGQIAFSYYWYLFVTWIPDYLVESRHLSLTRASVAAIIPYSVFTICEPLGGWIADRLIARGANELRVRKGMITLAFLTSLSLLFADRSHSDITAVMFVSLGAMVGLSTGNLLALIQRLAPSRSVGLWTGIVNFSGNLAGIVAPITTGVLIAKTSSYFAGFAVSVAVLLLGLPAYWCLVKEDAPVIVHSSEGKS